MLAQSHNLTHPRKRKWLDILCQHETIFEPVEDSWTQRLGEHVCNIAWYWGFFDKSIADWLSVSKILLLQDFKELISPNRLDSQTNSLIASFSAIYSASHDDRATVFWILLDQEIGALA
jgi:hypothetical protein